ncbi:MAG: normocyte-binding protein [Solirubrobacterales bacterium]
MNLKDVDIRQVYRNWKANTNEFECFVKSGPFVSLQTYKDFQLGVFNSGTSPSDSKIINTIVKFDQDVFIICDLELDRDVRVGAILNNVYSIKPVLCFNMLFHENGMIGTKDYIESLINYGIQLKNITPTKYVFMFDYNRYQDFDKSEYKRKLNNQYEICDADIPFAETLQSLGYTKVILFTKSTIKQDIQSYLNYLKEAGIETETITCEN